MAFAGHGELDKEGRTYLMPSDGSPKTLKQTGILANSIVDLLAAETCKAAQKVLIIDACHAAGERGAAQGFDASRLPVPPKGSGIVELFSCGKGEVSYEDEDKRHGLFSYYLIEAIGNPKADANGDGFVTVDEAKQYVDQQLAELFRTDPHYRGKSQTPTINGQHSGEIVLASIPRKPPTDLERGPHPPVLPGKSTDIALLTLPGPSGDWWFDEMPWFLPSLRAEIADRVPATVILAHPVDGKLPKRIDGPYNPDTKQVTAGLEKALDSARRANLTTSNCSWVLP